MSFSVRAASRSPESSALTRILEHAYRPAPELAYADSRIVSAALA